MTLPTALADFIENCPVEDLEEIAEWFDDEDGKILYGVVMNEIEQRKKPAVLVGDSVFVDFAKLSERKRSLKADLKDVAQEMAELEPGVLDSLTMSGLSKVRVKEAATTIFVERMLWAGVDKKSDQETTDEAYNRACAGLRRAGLRDFVHLRFNVMSLSAYYRELEREMDSDVIMEPSALLNRQLIGKIKLKEVIKAKTRKS